jgi:chromosome segregation ATPase
MWAVVPFVEHDESNTVETLKRRDSHNMELMDDFVEMERLAVLQSETAMPEAGVETASVASLQQQLSDLEKALADKDQDLQARSASLVHLQHQVDDLEKALEDKAQDLQTANESCRDLNLRLADSAEQIAALQACNDANETSMSNLQVQLDGLIAEQEGGGGAWSLSNHKDVPEGLPLIAELKACVSTISTHSYTFSCISQVP